LNFPQTPADRWINFVRQYGPVSANDAAFEDHTLRAARKAEVMPIEFEHPYLHKTLKVFQQQLGHSVILTGTAGDGKTHVCRRVWEALGGSKEQFEKNSTYLSLVLPNGQTLHLISDMSAWVPQHGQPWRADREALLQQFCQAIYDHVDGHCFLIAVNDGQLIESWRRLTQTPAVQEARQLFEELLVADEQDSPGVRLHFYNMSRGSSASLLDNALPAFLGHPGWQACFEGEEEHWPTYSLSSPIRRNYDLLGNPDLQKRLRSLFELCDYNGLHIPIRHILALLTNAVLGHAGPGIQDGLMQPADVPVILREGTVALASIYNNLFGGNLSEARRESISVFNYLERFRIGHETTNRVDNLLIFGESHEDLRPYFDRFLGSDEFYGAVAAYREARDHYIEGADEDGIHSGAFLPMLVAQRRALFFKITDADAEELPPWNLTVFRYAGEFLQRIVHTLKANQSVEERLVGQLVRGLNRIFVGMLVSNDQELYLGTSLHSTSARVSRLLEGKIPVEPDRGEGVEVVMERGKPLLRVSLDYDIHRDLPLNLVRYEFLSRVAEGALPSSFSKECYEDVLSFKSQVLAGLAQRKALGKEVSSNTLVFKPLVLDDHGNPIPGKAIRVALDAADLLVPSVPVGE
jgi:hypothetical protein